jgi:hypothetical protein
LMRHLALAGRQLNLFAAVLRAPPRDGYFGRLLLTAAALTLAVASRG